MPLRYFKLSTLKRLTFSKYIQKVLKMDQNAKHALGKICLLKDIQE